MAWFTLAHRRRKQTLRELFTVMRTAAHGEKDDAKKLIAELESD